MTAKFRIVFLYILLVFGLYAQNSSAFNDFYTECTKSYEFSDSPVDAVILSPLNRGCQSRCEKECGAFSRKGTAGSELNEDVILNCMTECQAGQLFSSIYKEIDPKNIKQTIAKGPVSIGAACNMTTEQKNKNAVRTSFQIKNGDQIRISLAGQDGDSKIYMCGRKAVLMQPIFPNTKSITRTGLEADSVWMNYNAQTEWTSNDDHVCFKGSQSLNTLLCTNFPVNDIKQYPNSSLWTSRMYYSDQCGWFARNPFFVSTGIFASNGDELFISWRGNYAFNKIKVGGNSVPADRSILVKRMRDYKTSTKTERDEAQEFFKLSSRIELKGSQTYQSYVVEGESFRKGPIGTHVQTPKAITPIFGLKGSIIDHGLDAPFQKSSSCNDTKLEDYQKEECIAIKQYTESEYTLTGVLEKFSSVKTNLGFRHYNTNTLIIGKTFTPGFTIGCSYNGDYKEAYGGYDIFIKWGGCPFYKGEHIQYAIVLGSQKNNNNKEKRMYDAIPDIPEESWQDVSAEVLKGEKDFIIKIDAPEDAKRVDRLFLRIKPMSGPASPISQKKLYEPENRHGKYYLFVQKIDDAKSLLRNGLITNIVKTVRDELFGKTKAWNYGDKVDNHTEINRRDGIVPKIYNSIISHYNYLNIIRAMIVMYLAFKGLGVAMGVVKMAQADFIKELIKLAFILTLISPQSWEFFGLFFVPMLVDGTVEVISMIMMATLDNELGGASISPEKLIADPYRFFEVFDAPLNIMIGTPTWKKIVAILFHDWLGIIMVFLMAVSILMHFLVIIKSTLLYLLSLVGMAAYIMMAPIIIPLLLYEYTKEIFDNWVKQLISFFLQPVFVFTSIAMFNFMIIMLIKMSLSFTVCPHCYIHIDLTPLYEGCWLSVWAPISTSHFPPEVDMGGSFMSKMGLVVAMFIIVIANYQLMAFLTSVVSLIVTGNFLREGSLGRMSEQGMAPIESLGAIAAKKMGKSAKSVAGSAVSKPSELAARGGIAAGKGVMALVNKMRGGGAGDK